ncbi:MAG: DUF2225 domain-containing protein [Oscillospiraceae bacterium]|nr:DUF2225 domain-containing protein [Oscillospiraceae bacterium]
MNNSAGHTDVRKADKDSLIFREGDRGSGEMYLILLGDVAVYYGEDQIPINLGKGDFIGETAVFLDTPYLYTAYAVTDVLLLALNKQSVMSFFGEQPGATFMLISSLCYRAEKASPALTFPYASFFENQLGEMNLKRQAVYSGGTDTQPGGSSRRSGSGTAAPAGAAVSRTGAKQNAGTGKKAEPKNAAGVSGGEKVKAGPARAYEAAQKPELRNEKTPEVSIFPEGHGSYTLPIDNSNTALLFDKTFTCPICGKSFRSLSVRTSKLVAESTDSDMRVHYKDIEPMYYDVTTCPSCYYTALVDSFTEGSANKAQFEAKMKEYRNGLKLKFNRDRDTDAVFKGYYLALLCVPICFRSNSAVAAKLWLKLSRLYSDCGDEKMSGVAAEHSLEEYLNTYTKQIVTDSQGHQICVMLGELYIKKGDYKDARQYFFKVISDRSAAPVLKKHAENRIEDIKDISG